MAHKIKILSSLVSLLLFFISCGEGSVDIDVSTYLPKIAVEAFLFPGKKVEGIRITKNVALNTMPDPISIFLSAADVRIIDMSTNKEYKLTYNPAKYTFEYNGSDLVIDYDRDYRLKVSASFDGFNLSASAVTHTPKAGFHISDSLSEIQPMFYREKDVNGDLKNFSITFSPSLGTDFYAFSIVALNASDSTFNYDNAYADIKREDVVKDLDQYKYQLIWLQNVNSAGQQISYNLNWIQLWFYGDYRVVVYAGDSNYKNFLLTYRTVQDFDGNFHEPNMKLDGDGIGIFASVIADTVYLHVKK
jgi:hypothetical protein